MLIVIRIMYSMTDSMASDYVEPQFYSHTPDMIGTEPGLVLFSKYFTQKYIRLDLFILLYIYICFDEDTVL